ncbi:MAG: KpsF/GutQ family sugar-phosphate isomerase [Cellvibrionales bacterium]|jgi:arabinose-5-phosphate isomerase|nr:KpsF/GutQ family sugar-phosphate isomerase [Cellvibrionales bacterium]MCH9798041.1 KpsF/GutQ family sugar-phosphate isomerase [Gammaproteobacteria bacterium]MDA7737724.1 KpsF/GutQ family sugar-phosphate isomerase [Porticoccus sp.]MBT7437372.1 KpsF/GutQ family sugar-phosphate isomerase [Cellvibrionales bacterium]MCH9842652.1 KpsF/GutQ family sugar-phosphate isomerase [Gammaproteobacteria bacterium]
MIQNDYLKVAKRTIKMESEAVALLEQRIGNEFTEACKLIINCSGRVIVTGMGKSGHIGRKIAATFASTGTPAFFVHPGEASHGDIGMITKKDVVLALSNSGTTAEVVTLLPQIKRLGVPLICMTGDQISTLARAAEVHLDVRVNSEACPLGLAPTTSTTVTLVMGDALAIALLEARGFTAEDFAFSHPGGALGQKLLLKVRDIMHSGENLPRVNINQPLKEALLEMSKKGFGMTTVVKDTGKLFGVFTDGDLRRAINEDKNVKSILLSEVTKSGCKSIHQDALAAEALKIIEDLKITTLVIENSDHEPVGILHLHDILKAGVV